jgi:hypothetical protein
MGEIHKYMFFEQLLGPYPGEDISPTLMEVDAQDLDSALIRYAFLTIPRDLLDGMAHGGELINSSEYWARYYADAVLDGNAIFDIFVLKNNKWVHCMTGA